MFENSKDNKKTNLADNAGRGNTPSSNVAQESTLRTMDAFASGSIREGQVIRAGAGLYDVVVAGQLSLQTTCVLPGQSMSYFLGVSDCSIPVEGSRVVFYVPSGASSYGVILGVLPSSDHGSPLTKAGKNLQMFIHQLDVEPFASYATESCYRTPWEDGEYLDMINSHMGRPVDLFPGNRAWINEQGICLAILNLMTVLKATEKSKIEFSVIDDLVKITSGYFRHIHSQGEDRIYNDGGFVTRVVTGTSYQCEHSGFTDYDKKLTEKDDGKSYMKESSKSVYKLLKDDLESKKRFQMLAGHLGDILNYFVAKPDPDQNPETLSADSKDQGLMHTHVDSSGRVIMRSAAGISLQRWDRIPVPKRQKEPWDPKGTKLDDDSSIVKTKTPFKISTDYPYSKSMVLRDMMSWYQGQAYQRIHELSKSNSQKDYYLPEEKDLKTPDNEYDKQGKGSENFKDYDLRQAYLNVEPDGSIIIRDAWGSELLMRGGNIILSCAGQVELRSGGSIVQLAGYDIISKARRSIDITATDRDVRIKANGNLHMLSEGRSGSTATGGGGILLESLSTQTSEQFSGTKGEQVYSTGIIFKAKNSQIFAQGKTVHLSGSDATIIEGFDDKGKNTGKLEISVDSIISNTKTYTYMTSGKSSLLYLDDNQALVMGGSAYLVGGNGLGLLRGSKYWVPLTEADIPTNYYTELQPQIETLKTSFQGTDWLNPFDPSSRVDIEFTYRSTTDYGTNTATEVQGSTKFQIYQPAWAYMANQGSKMLNVKVDSWTEYEISSTMPWPGKDAYDAESYIVLTKEVNIDDPATGLPKARKELKDTSDSITAKKFSEYEVVKN